MKWHLTFKSKMYGNLEITAIKLSTIGDMCVMGGNKFISVWT